MLICDRNNRAISWLLLRRIKSIDIAAHADHLHRQHLCDAFWRLIDSEGQSQVVSAPHSQPSNIITIPIVHFLGLLPQVS